MSAAARQLYAGEWKLVDNGRYLTFDATGYDVPLDGVTTVEHVQELLSMVAAKTWVTKELLAQLTRLLLDRLQTAQASKEEKRERDIAKRYEIEMSLGHIAGRLGATNEWLPVPLGTVFGGWRYGVSREGAPELALWDIEDPTWERYRFSVDFSSAERAAGMCRHLMTKDWMTLQELLDGIEATVHCYHTAELPPGWARVGGAINRAS